MAATGRTNVKKLGLIVNPIAGLGGSVGLKGTDGASTYRKGVGDGGRSPRRADGPLRPCEKSDRLDDLEVLTYSGPMGEDEAREAGLSHTRRRVGRCPMIPQPRIRAARPSKWPSAIRRPDPLCGWRRHGAGSIAARWGTAFTALGIPAGVKMYSGVYATTPRAAGRAAAQLLAG